LGLVGTLVLCGCDTAPPGDPAAPTGGQVFVVDAAVYAATVAPILTNKGCDNVVCHGGGLRGSFELSPFDDKDLDFDFIQVVRQLNPQEPVASTLLTKPLAQAAGGDVHTAPSEQFGFMTVDDPDYQAILAWIEAGELQ
jgi:hypothetical protein